MELKEKLTQFNTVLFALQVEITKVTDKTIGEKLQSLLFCMQMGLAQMYREMTDNFDQREKRPSNNDERIASQSPQIALDCNCGNKKSENGLLKFNDKEIFKMPVRFRKTFRTQGKTVCYRIRTDGRYCLSYEIRYAKAPFNKRPISVSAQTLADAKMRFIEKINELLPLIEREENGTVTAVPDSVNGFAEYWFENFHRRKVCEKTYKLNYSLYNRHLKSALEPYNLKSITPVPLQHLLDGLPCNGKTTDDCRSILNQIFELAVAHGKIKVNPLNLFVHVAHERKTGVELTHEEEISLLSACDGTDYQIIFAVLLYTGLRPNEYKTAKVDGDFIVAVNSKRKNGKIEYKKIPINKHLKKHIDRLTELPQRHERNIALQFKDILPDHTLKDLRKTFNTRCVECKVDYVARKMFMGHSEGKLDKTYTGSVDGYLLSEGEKLDNWYLSIDKK